MSKIEVDAVEPQSGTSLTLGASGDTVTVPSGVTLDASNATLTLPDNSVSLAKLTATGTKDSTTFLRGDNTFAAAGGANTPAFEAYLSSITAISHNTATKVPCNTEVIDTDSCYDNATNYRFTPNVAGKYYFYFNLRGWSGGSAPDGTRFIVIRPYKNGSSVAPYNGTDTNDNTARAPQMTASTVIDMNGTTDYVEFYATIYAENLSSSGVGILNDHTSFGAYKIIE